ncbi:T9SS type A sorting domain-containing protein [Hymenobacter sp. BRD67]|uniref:T9SS type A sorting domain-containing protein n=1 Tax=Hymenobacter sp. BRD67 TaxID=2675877 RepID=UPI001564FFA1|nr:T9SS type A sorting domain-containing protein [Hymenobacter sp. BRD67]QKG51373.1 T9SS type A sorting domain-containing protein [Hymenobacter sp. BRD67]
MLSPALLQAQTIVLQGSLQGFGTIPVNRTSASQSFQVSGQNLADNVTVTAPAGYEMRVGSNSFSSAAITLAPSAGTVSATSIDVRLAPVPSGTHPDGTGDYSGSITATASGAATQSAAVTGNAPAGPYVFVDPATLPFGQVSGSGSGQTKTFVVGGGNLGTTALTLTAALTGSTTSGAIQLRNVAVSGTFATSLTIAPINGQVPETTIEVRIVGPIASQSNFTGTITASSGSAVAAPDNVVQVTGNNPFTGSNTSSTFTVSNPSGGQPLLPFSTVPGKASASQQLLVSGSFLVNPITVVAPNNFQIALDQAFTGLGDGSTGTTTGNTISISPAANGTINNQTLYVRYVPQVAGTESGTGITFDSSPATSIATIVQANSIGSVQSRTTYVKPGPLVIGPGVRSTAQLIHLHAELVSSAMRISVSSESAGALGNPRGYAQFRVSLDGTTYTDPTAAGTSYLVLTPDASTNLIDQDIYVVYAPTRVGAAQAVLQYLTPDVTASPANTLTPVVSSFSTTDANKLLGTTIAVAPTRDTPFTATRNTGESSASITFNPDNQYSDYGQFHIVLISTSSSLTTPDVQPVNATDYNSSNGSFQGTGQSTLQDSKGNVYYVVFTGGGPATITNLNPNTNYYAYVFDYNSTNPNSTTFINNAENYKSPAQSTVFGALLPGSPPLPVGLTAFLAQLQGAAVRVSWTTASEVNNAGFVVERSTSGQDFTSVGNVDGAGTSASTHSYSLLDTRLPAGATKLYYRLRQTDLNGISTYSPIRTVSLAGEPSPLQLVAYPNPAREALHVQVLGATTSAPLELFDALGRLVRSQAAPALGTEATLPLNNLPAGFYMLRCGQLSQRLTLN